MKKFKPNFNFADLWKKFVQFTSGFRRKDTGELVMKDKVEFDNDMKCFENIVDKDGHKRFVEGDITCKTITGLTQIYGKWSLSGTHLMIVIGASIDSSETSEILRYTTLAKVELPQWVYDKISVFKGTGIAWKSAEMVDANWNKVDNEVLLQKNNGIFVIINSDITITSNTEFRVQFDLLIDDADSE